MHIVILHFKDERDETSSSRYNLENVLFEFYKMKMCTVCKYSIYLQYSFPNNIYNALLLSV